LDRGDRLGFAKSLVALALHCENPSDVLQLVQLAAVDPDPTVRGNALVSIAHLSRRFKASDEAVIRPIVQRGFTDPDWYVKGHARTAAEDLAHFEGWHFE
jgi:hypothetical protein